MATVSAVHLHKKFGELEAVKDLTFDCKDANLLFILGPSGAGKTTTLMLIAGLYDLDGGDIFIDEKAVNDLHPWERNVSMAFESYALYPHFTVFENLAFPLKSPKHLPVLSPKEIQDKVKKTAEMLQIGGLLDRKPSELSGGQRQRVSLGRVLVRNAAVYLLDEPLLHLDAKLRYEMMGELKELQKNLGVTMIMVGPDFVEALSIADEIVVVNHGMVVQQIGSPEEIFAKPKNIFVADLIGEPRINLFECDLTSEGEKLYLTAKELKVEVPEKKKVLSHIKPGEKIILGIRARDIQLTEEAIGQDVVKGVLTISEPLGWSILVECMVGDKLVKFVAEDGHDLSRGREVFLKFNQEKLHLFEKASGQSLR